MLEIFAALTQQQYFGNTLLQYTLFLAVVTVFLVVGKVVGYFIKNHFKKFTAKTGNKFDDILLDLIEKPIWLAMLITGLAAGFQFLTFTEATQSMYYNVINILVVLFVGWLLIRFVGSIMKELIHPLVSATDSKLDDQLVPLLEKLTKGTIAVLVLIVIVSSFGYDITALLAGLGIGGLAFAFAAKETISDVFGGFSIFTSKPFVVGDSIKTSDVIGKVEEVGLRHTRIRNLDKRSVIVPNSRLARSVIINITAAPQRKCVWHLGVTYATSVKKLEKAKQIIVGAINAHKECKNGPVVEFEGFGDFSLNLLVVFYTKKNDFKQFVRVRSEIGMQIKREFEKAGIEFAFPTQTIHVKK